MSRDAIRGRFSRARRVGVWSVWAAFVLGSLALLLAVRWDAFGFRMTTFSAGSDAWEHAAALRRLLDDPWSPGNPHVLSSDSSPRYMPHYLLVALGCRAVGILDALDALGVAALINTLVFTSGIGFFFWSYFKDARAPLYGLIVLFCSWIDGFHFSNVYQLKVYFSVASYPSTAALGVTLHGLAIATRLVRAPRVGGAGLVLLGALSAYLFLLHPLTACAGLVGMGALIVTEPGASARQRAALMAAMVAGLALSHFWPYFSPFEVALGGKSETSSEWVKKAVVKAASADSESVELHRFYDVSAQMKNLGLSLIGIPVVLFFVARGRHLFVVTGAVALGVPFLVNAYVPIPLGHRFVLLANLFLQIAVVWLLLRLSPRYVEPSGSLYRIPGSALLERWSGRLEAKFRAARWRVTTLRVLGVMLVTLMLGWMALENVDVATERFAQYEKRYRHRQRDGSFRPTLPVRLALVIRKTAPPDAVVLGDSRSLFSLSAWGPHVVAPLHNNPLLPDRRRRAHEITEFRSKKTSDERRQEILEKYGVTHVLLAKRAPPALRNFLKDRQSESRPLPSGETLVTLRRAEREP